MYCSNVTNHISVLRCSARGVFVVLLLWAIGSAPGNVQAQAQTAASSPGVFDVRNYGAKGDGHTVDTQAISRAIDAASDAGGGEVLIPPGIFVTGTFALKSDMTLRIERGAVLLGSPNVADYAGIADYGFGKNYGVDQTGEGLTLGMIVARDVHDVAITGGGTIDGNSDGYFDFQKAHYILDFDPRATRQGQRMMNAIESTEDGPVEVKSTGRPGTLMVFDGAQNVLLRDITIRNSPNWTIDFQNAGGIVVSGVRVLNDPMLPNNDGLDCMSCRDLHVSDSTIKTGDDDMAIVNSRDVTVTNSSLESRSSALRIENVQFGTFDNLTMHTNRGVGIYGRGSDDSSDLLFSNLAIETQLYKGHWWGKGEPVYIALAAPKSAEGKDTLQDVQFMNITATADAGVVLYGSPGARIRNVSINNLRLTLRAHDRERSREVGGNFDLRWTAASREDGMFKHDIPGIYCRYVDNLLLQDVAISWGRSGAPYFSSAIQCSNYNGLRIDGFSGKAAPNAAGERAIAVSHGTGLTIRDSQ